MNWLDRLRTLAQRTCVRRRCTRRPTSTRCSGSVTPACARSRPTSAGDIVDQILGVASTRGATLVGDGPLTGPAVALLSAQGPTVGDRRRPTRRSGLGGRRSADRRRQRRAATRRKVVAAPFDPAVGAALAGAGTMPRHAVVPRCVA